MARAPAAPWVRAAVWVVLGVGIALVGLELARTAPAPGAPAAREARTPRAERPKAAKRRAPPGVPQATVVASSRAERPPNVLLLIADDVGQDMVGAYGLSEAAPETPRLDALAGEGVLFRQAIANPVCSPTRATLVTGQYAWRMGIGNAIPPKPGWALQDDVRTLAQALDEATADGYASAVVGKWHLASPDHGGLDQPRRMGFDHHLGTMSNLNGLVEGEPETYFRWQRVVDGEASVGEGYITTVTVDDALDLTRSLPEPWFLLIGFHAAHFPMHQPPQDLTTTPLPRNPSESDLYRAMVEAMDTEIGRLLDGLGEQRERTNVIFLGDNGSAHTAVRPPLTPKTSKGSLHRGGVRVPFVVSGPGVVGAGRETDALVNTTDVFATALAWAGGGSAPVDSISFHPVLEDPAAPAPRTFAYAERFGPNGPAATWTWHESIVRDARHKLFVRNGEEAALFDMVADPLETRNLLRKGPTKSLRKVLTRLRDAAPEVVWTPRSGVRPRDDD